MFFRLKPPLGYVGSSHHNFRTSNSSVEVHLKITYNRKGKSSEPNPPFWEIPIPTNPGLTERQMIGVYHHHLSQILRFDETSLRRWARIPFGKVIDTSRVLEAINYTPQSSSDVRWARILRGTKAPCLENSMLHIRPENRPLKRIEIFRNWKNPPFLGANLLLVSGEDHLPQHLDFINLHPALLRI